MLSFFPPIYKDEALYSIIARYHKISGNTSLKDTLKNCFSLETAIPTVEFPCNLEYLASQLPAKLGINSNYFIDNTTMLPVYAPFLPPKRQKEIINAMKYGDGKGIKHKIGFIAGGVCKKDGLYYCPLCAAEELEKNMEVYYHRLNQLQGIVICHKHKCILKKHSKLDASRLKFIPIKSNEIDMNVQFLEQKEISQKLEKITASLKYLCGNDLKAYYKEKVESNYQRLLEENSLVTVNGSIRQKELYEKFISFWGEEVLELLESSIDFDNEYNWLKIITRNSKRVVHPIRHVLLINFLCNSIEEFFNIATPKASRRKHPCLNPVANHYKELVIDKVKETFDYKRKEKVGTFICNCGFVYSRRIEDDIYKVRRIEAFGHVWENRLAELIKEKKYSIREIARKLRCDPKTIVKYAQRIGMEALLQSNMKVKTETTKNYRSTVDRTRYRQTVLQCILDYPNIKRTELRGKLYKEYSWLYKNDRIWLEEYLPSKRKPMGNNNNHNVDWEKRDKTILEMLQKEYDNIIKNDENRRVTRSLLGRRINSTALLEKHLDKLPESKRLLEEIVENVEDFQLRRVERVCRKLHKEKGVIRKWEVIRAAGLRPNYSTRVENRILFLLSFAETNNSP